MVPANFSTYYYQGSLTTPPCSEVVNWNVVDKPVLLAQKDYDALFSYILKYVGENCTSKTIAFANSTARPLQARNGRSIARKCPKGLIVAAPNAPAPVAAPNAPAPVASPVAAPAKAPVATDAPVKAPIIIATTNKKKCGLFKLRIFCLNSCGVFGRFVGLCID
jgi:Eukaryotic-type carbonic anhydrase